MSKVFSNKNLKDKEEAKAKDGNDGNGVNP